MLCYCVQIRKQQKDHAELIEDYRSKQQQQRALQPAAPLLSQPPASMQPRPGGPAPARAPNVTPGWPPGARAPGVMAQRMPPHLPPQMPPALPNTPPAPPHTQSPPVMLPGLTAPTAGFPAGPRGPTSGPSGAAGDGASRQVTTQSFQSVHEVCFSNDDVITSTRCFSYSYTC